jgi:hypothetical protein
MSYSLEFNKWKKFEGKPMICISNLLNNTTTIESATSNRSSNEKAMENIPTLIENGISIYNMNKFD